MKNLQTLSPDLLYLGGNDRRLALFENIYPLPRGVSYNSYLLLDETTVLLDTVDQSIGRQFIQNLQAGLDGRPLDFLVINHMEPDHAALIPELFQRYPSLTLVGNDKTLKTLGQFFDAEEFDFAARFWVVKNGDTLSTGRHVLSFIMAPMVHWPEVMVTYDTTDKILFSADAFGSFGALSGCLFADQVNFERDWLADARRYYTNIVGKYGVQVKSLLQKAAALDLRMICPLHGPIWRNNLAWFVDKHLKWATYEPEGNGVLIAYGSIYGGTANAAEILANKLAARGLVDLAVYDVGVTSPDVLLAEAFRCRTLVFASSTYNAGIFTPMEILLRDIAAHNLQNRTVALIENGSWGPASGGLMRSILESIPGTTVLDETLTLRSTPQSGDLNALDAISNAVACAALGVPDATGGFVPSDRSDSTPRCAGDTLELDSAAFFTLSYGLFVLTAQGKNHASGCIINTVTQITDNPKRISIAVNKNNFTHDLVLESGAFNISVLTEQTPFSVFQHYGFQSGRDVDKFAGQPVQKSANGLWYVAADTNAFFSARVLDTYDTETHTVFIAEVTEAAKLSPVPSATYQYYFDHIKPKPIPSDEPKKGYVCKICGYVHESEDLPDDFICPLCKHGASDFEPL